MRISRQSLADREHRLLRKTAGPEKVPEKKPDAAPVATDKEKPAEKADAKTPETPEELKALFVDAGGSYTPAAFEEYRAARDITAGAEWNPENFANGLKMGESTLGKAIAAGIITPEMLAAMEAKYLERKAEAKPVIEESQKAQEPIKAAVEEKKGVLRSIVDFFAKDKVYGGVEMPQMPGFLKEMGKFFTEKKEH